MICRSEIFNNLLRSRAIEAEIATHPIQRIITVVLEEAFEFRAQTRYGLRQFVGAGRGLAEPEWNGRRLASGVLDPHRAALNPNDTIGRVAKLEDVALDAFDREILVDGADDDVFGLEQDLEIGIIRNRSS